MPRLVAAGWSVALADADRALVAALAEGGRYPLLVTDGATEERREVRVAGAFHPADAGADARLARAGLVTTAVRRENLGRVAAALVAAWSRHGMPETVTVVGCENVERVDDVLAGAFAAAGMTAEQRARLVLPRTVVDRICAADWPAGLLVTTEPFAELAVGEPAAIEGVETVADIDARFARKRYLVNSFADASALLGAARGHGTLAAAVSDTAVEAEIAPLLAALRLHLTLAHGFAPAALDAYLAQSRRRLANAAIPRRIETVARDFARKLGPTERFAEPLIDLEARGCLDEDAVAVVAALVRAAGPGEGLDRTLPDGTAGLPPAAARFYARLAAAIRA